MKGKKKGILSEICAIAAAAALLAGCGSTMETEEMVVRPRTEILQEQVSEDGGAADGVSMASSGQTAAGKIAGDDTGGRGTTGDDTAGKIAEQVQAPEVYRTDFSEGKISISVDAAVEVPDAAGFRKLRVKPGVFTQEDYDAINRAVLSGGALWDRDEEAMAGSNGFTKEELQEMIDQLEAEKASGVKGSELYGGKEINYDEQIEEWKKLLEQAPEEPVISQKEAVVAYEPGNAEKNALDGYVTSGGRDYSVHLTNSMEDGFFWSIFKVEAMRRGSNYLFGKPKEAQEASFSEAAVREQAETLLEELGFAEYGYAGEEFAYNLISQEDGSVKVDEVAYGIHFTRQIDGIPVTYAHEEGLQMKQADDICWPAEFLDLIYNEDGFVCLDWESPYEVEEISDEYVFLLPFSEIEGIFREMVQKKYEDLYKDDGITKVALKIDRIRLGYMRVMEDSSDAQGWMLPVWDFFGSRMITYADGRSVAQEGPYECLFTINATDGTVIDKLYGR